MRNFSISRFGIQSLLQRNCKNQQNVDDSAPGPSRRRHAPSRTPEVVTKVRRAVTCENPMTQRAIAKRTGVSQSTVYNIIHKNLRLQRRHKGRVHKLLGRHVQERKTNCRKLYEKYLAGEKWKFVVTLDEAWVYLDNCNKPRAIYYRPIDKQPYQKWAKECRESFSKGFMVIAGYSYKGKLRIRRVGKNVKMNSVYYQTNVLTPLYRTEIPALYGPETGMAWIHQDKASSHTSKTTRSFMNRMQNETGINAIPFEDIPVKSPDASPMDFCAFGLLKRALGKRRPRTLDGLWKACKEEWEQMDMSSLQRSLLQWKLRCRAIVKQAGYQIEHDRSWRHKI